MRAERLLLLMMLLQANGRMTAKQLASELEVSERTIYRDIDALSAAGVPIYAAAGPGGGCALLDSYRTNLTGLTEDEVRAIFMLTIPASLAELGVSEELKSAFLKLAASLPDGRRQEGVRARQRFHLDSTSWFQAEEPVPHLQTIQEAVWADRKLYLTFQLAFETTVMRLVDPYGLVAKAGAWYLVFAVADTIRVQRVSRIVDSRLSPERFARPQDFDLPLFWQTWCQEFEKNRPHYAVLARVAPHFIPYLPTYFGRAIQDEIDGAGPPDVTGWLTLTLPFETFHAARERILSFGGAVEVLEPQALRLSVADFARQTLSLYAAEDRCSGSD